MSTKLTRRAKSAPAALRTGKRVKQEPTSTPSKRVEQEPTSRQVWDERSALAAALDAPPVPGGWCGQKLAVQGMEGMSSKERKAFKEKKEDDKNVIEKKKAGQSKAHTKRRKVRGKFKLARPVKVKKEEKEPPKMKK